MKPRLSIGLPLFNGQPYLAEAVEALLGQNWGDFELLISDNASTDGSDQIAARFARTDKRIRLVRQPKNLGAAANFNYVFRRGAAPYFKWACADDSVAPGFLGYAVAELDAHPETVLCYGATTLVDGQGRSLGAFQQGLDLRSPDEVERFRTARSYSGLLNVLQGVMRTPAIRGKHPMGTFPGSDEALMVELALHGTFRELPHPMLSRRMHAEAASAERNLEARQVHLNPAAQRTPHLEKSRRSIHELRAVLRAPISLRSRWRVLRVVLTAMAANRNALRWELTDIIRITFARMFGRRRPATQG